MVGWETEPGRKEIGICAACGEPIYEGDVIRRDGRHLLHCDKSCLEDWMHTNWPVEELFDAVGITEEFAYEGI